MAHGALESHQGNRMEKEAKGQKRQLHNGLEDTRDDKSNPKVRKQTPEGIPHERDAEEGMLLHRVTRRTSGGMSYCHRALARVAITHTVTSATFHECHNGLLIRGMSINGAYEWQKPPVLGRVAGPLTYCHPFWSSFSSAGKDLRSWCVRV